METLVVAKFATIIICAVAYARLTSINPYLTVIICLAVYSFLHLTTVTKPLDDIMNMGQRGSRDDEYLEYLDELEDIADPVIIGGVRSPGLIAKFEPFYTAHAPAYRQAAFAYETFLDIVKARPVLRNAYDNADDLRIECLNALQSVIYELDNSHDIGLLQRYISDIAAEMEIYLEDYAKECDRLPKNTRWRPIMRGPKPVLASQDDIGTYQFHL
jgi:hypothetical protein